MSERKGKSMIRTFDTHRVRTQKELTGKLWDFMPCQGENAGKVYRVVTPCCWENHPEFTRYRGDAEYTTRFEAEGNIRLEFKGVSHTATVFLDEKEITNHYNAYTSFSSIVKKLDKGMHTLTIRVDNRFSEKSALHIPNDYMSYGGVSRPVLLEQVGDAYIKWIHITPYLNGSIWSTKIEVNIENISDENFVYDIDVEIDNKILQWKNVYLEKSKETVVCKSEGFENALPWMTNTPNLYYVTASLLKNGEVVDDYIDRFGFRQVSILGKNILVNGEKIKIKGLCRHEDHPQFGCALPFSAIAADMEIIKHLGANSIRTSHYPNDELFLDLCDEQGILVWEENHARGLSEKDMRNPNFQPQAEKVIREMITDHYNHPSIYIWGILNECASDSEYGKECYRKQFELIKQMDTSRPHSFASCKFKTDISFGLPDVVSYNIYPLWYHDTPVDEYLDDLYQWVQNETEGVSKPFMITEIGAGGLYGYRNSHNSKWTEEYQAETLKKQLKTVLGYENCIGVYIWQFCDIRISDEWFGTRPRTMNNKGIVDEYRRRKLSYDVVKRIFEKI